MNEKARMVVLARRPGADISVDDFAVEDRSLPEPGEGQVRVRNRYISVDPYMRLALSDRNGVSAAKPVGEAMTGGAVGIVEASRAHALPVGTMVTSQFGWRDRFVADAAAVQPVAADVGRPSWYLGILGLTGLTAYAGIEYILEPKPGETIFVSGAAGAVGSVATQLAKARGCRVVATAGTDDKVAWLEDELGLDAVANYATTDLAAFLAQECPGGIDHYFDNVGGPTLDAAITAMKPRGRIVVCGAISQYNTPNYCAGPGEFFKISEKGITIVGLNVGMWFDRGKEAFGDLARRLAAGELVWKETVVDGLDNAPHAFVSLFSGQNRGKMVVAIDPAP
jgi:NADPH:quinone reductase